MESIILAIAKEGFFPRSGSLACEGAPSIWITIPFEAQLTVPSLTFTDLKGPTFIL